MADEEPTSDETSEELIERPCERPLECTECKRPIAVHYTEIVNKVMSHTCMCEECPVLRRRLQGPPHIEGELEVKEVGTLACGNCGTTLEAIRVGTTLGCDLCYKVFDDVLLSEMLLANKIPQRLVKNKASTTIHMGRPPGQIQEISPSLRLLALNEALSEMLKSEDYEQAALLRDQIKALTEKSGKTERKNNGKQKT